MNIFLCFLTGLFLSMMVLLLHVAVKLHTGINRIDTQEREYIQQIKKIWGSK